GMKERNEPMLDQIFGFLNHTLTIGSFSITFSISGFIEILIFAILSYYVIVWIKRTKAWNLLKGIVVLAVIYLVAYLLGLNNLTFIFRSLFSSLLLAIIIIFQPELRRGLEQIGERNLIRKFFPGSENGNSVVLSGDSIEAIVSAMTLLGRNKIGALIVIERKIDLREFVNTGITLDAKISAALLEQIFEHNTPLHDGAVIIRNNRIVSATCYLPLSQNMTISKELGTRHRAGLGISEVSDCITLIASEETGFISIAENGVLQRNVTQDEVRSVLAGARLEEADQSTKNPVKRWIRRQKHES
ncbi:MAG: diadenylate cyclase CdaA, partial [Lachnospiraceae bacterium]|nr:diadenylate cyclase CdaA [Lachnospiraceae bacterium]